MQLKWMISSLNLKNFPFWALLSEWIGASVNGLYLQEVLYERVP
jgi:hypothetical protein